MNPVNSSDNTSSPTASEGDLRALKELLFRDELEALSELREDVDDSKLGTEELADMLPKAIHRASKNGDRLGRALGPTIADAFQKSVKTNRQALADAISPIIGPAITRSISNTIRGMIQSFNKTLEYSLSAKGLKWRWEAFRTGKSFGEVVLLNVLEYRVERTFLIHREDGILLAEFVNDEAPEADADLVSGMLTALRDLGRDSLGARQHESLDTVDFGDRTLWLESGEYATLAAVILGHPPKALRLTMQAAVSAIHDEFGDALREFDGNTEQLAGTEERMAEWKAVFSAADLHLEKCTVTQFRDDLGDGTNGGIWKWAWVVPVLLVALVAFWACGKWYRASQVVRALSVPESVEWDLNDGTLKLTGEAHHDWIEEAEVSALNLSFVDSIDTEGLNDLDAAWVQAVNQLSMSPGIAITETARTHRGYRIAGLRDPLAAKPAEIFASVGVPLGQVEASWTDFHSLEPAFVERRFRNRLPECDSVTWEWTNGILRGQGSAPREWVESARLAAAGNLGQVDISDVEAIDDPAMRATHQKWLSVVAALSDTPGIAITRSEPTPQGYSIVGLRDPLASDPTEIMRAAGVDPSQITTTWTPFTSMDPELVAKRFQQRLPDAPRVAWDWKNGTLFASGTASHVWLKEARAFAKMMRDDLRVDLSAVQDLEIGKRDQLKRKIEEIRISHDSGRTGLAADEVPKLRRARELIEELRTVCERMSCLPQVVIVGYADSQTPANQVAAMSIARARAVWQVLGQLGLADQHIIVQGGNPRVTQNERGDSGFRVSFLGLPAG